MANRKSKIKCGRSCCRADDPDDLPRHRLDPSDANFSSFDYHSEDILTRCRLMLGHSPNRKTETVETSSSHKRTRLSKGARQRCDNH
jgi:hypothetical protein